MTTPNDILYNERRRALLDAQTRLNNFRAAGNFDIASLDLIAEDLDSSDLLGRRAQQLKPPLFSFIIQRGVFRFGGRANLTTSNLQEIFQELSDVVTIGLSNRLATNSLFDDPTNRVRNIAGASLGLGQVLRTQGPSAALGLFRRPAFQQVLASSQTGRIAGTARAAVVAGAGAFAGSSLFTGATASSVGLSQFGFLGGAAGALLGPDLFRPEFLRTMASRLWPFLVGYISLEFFGGTVTGQREAPRISGGLARLRDIGGQPVEEVRSDLRRAINIITLSADEFLNNPDVALRTIGGRPDIVPATAARQRDISNRLANSATSPFVERHQFKVRVNETVTRGNRGVE